MHPASTLNIVVWKYSTCTLAMPVCLMRIRLQSLVAKLQQYPVVRQTIQKISLTVSLYLYLLYVSVS